MSKTLYKIEFEYDDNCGNCYQPLSKFVCYEIINNCCDYEEVVDENGDYVELRGSDSFIENLILCLSKPPFTDSMIECFDDTSVNIFIGYKTAIKKIIAGKLYLEFEVNDTKFNAEWHADDNFAVR